MESLNTPVLDIIPILTTNAESNDFNIRLASVQTLGNICEDVDPGYFSEDIINSILYALLQNIFPEQIELTKLATSAFSKAAPITSRNFPNKA